MWTAGGSTIARQRSVSRSDVRAFVVEAIAADVPQLANQIQKRFDVSRQTAHNYIRELIDDHTIERAGSGRYTLVEIHKTFTHAVDGLEEDRVWADELSPILKGRLPRNVLQICHYGATEMINNVIDHSESAHVLVQLDHTAAETVLAVVDHGVGIFRKIATELELEDDRHAVLELSKGKVTTDPQRHSGEGIFFSSRAFDKFRILSGGIYFTHSHETDADWILGEEHQSEDSGGTSVFMTMRTESATNLSDVFATFTGDDGEFGFDKTIVPVSLVAYGDELLVSRSQAKRLLNRFDRFRTVILDFEGVPSIGQAFADEIFRVFSGSNPDVEIVPVNANEEVARMIMRATSA